MNPILSLVLVALVYILIVGVISFLRREGFSFQFVVEALIGTAVAVGVALATGWIMHPVFLLAFLYLLTMRARLLVDVGNLLAGRGHHRAADSSYQLALRLRPDEAAQQIVQLNQGVHFLKQNLLTEAVERLEGVLQRSMSPKHEAAARYNLAVGYQRQGNDGRAIVEYNKVIDLMPGSLYGMGAQKALQRARRQQEAPESEEQGDSGP